MSEKLMAGFSRVNITPENGVAIEGYFIPRKVEGVLDDLEVNVIALAKDDKKVLIMSLDVCQVRRASLDILRKAVSDATGVSMEAIYATSTHTHTGPCVGVEFEGELEKAYFKKLEKYMVAAALLAIDNMKPARMGWKTGLVPGMSCSRRYRMKDGSVRTNPGKGNPDVVEAVGEMDSCLNLLRFDQEDGESLLIVNYGNHPDSVGGCKVSADWPGFMRRTVETCIPNTKCLFLNGAEGDVGTGNVWQKDGDMNDMFLDFDDVWRGYKHTEHMGRLVAGVVLGLFAKVNYTEKDDICFKQRNIKVPGNVPDPSEMEMAHYYNDLHNAGKDHEIPFKGMMLTTVVAEAWRMVTMEHGPEVFDMMLSGITIGDVAIVGIPGEPFTGVGLGIKESEGYDMVMVCCNANGAEGYFPMKDSYEEGGYEARSSFFKCGAAEYLIEEGQALLKEIRA